MTPHRPSEPAALRSARDRVVAAIAELEDARTELAQAATAHYGPRNSYRLLTAAELDVTGCDHRWWPLHPNTVATLRPKLTGRVWQCGNGCRFTTTDPAIALKADR
jgi:hypothetical protein